MINKMRQRFIIGFLIISLVGCVNMANQRQREAWIKAGQFSDECKQMRLNGEISGYEASHHCSANNIRQVMADSGFPYMDLIDLALAYRLAASKRADNGDLSEEEFLLHMAELNKRMNDEIMRRNTMAQQAYNQRLQSMGMFMQGMGTWQQSLNPTPRGPITCYQYGNMIQCQ